MIEEEKEPSLNLKNKNKLPSNNDFFLPDIHKKAHSAFPSFSNKIRNRNLGFGEYDDKGTHIPGRDSNKPGIEVGLFEKPHRKNTDPQAKGEKNNGSEVNISHPREDHKNEITAIFDNTYDPIAKNIYKDADNQDNLDPVFLEDNDKEEEKSAVSEKKKNTNIYEINYNKIGGETLKEIYEVKYFLIFPDMQAKQFWDLFITILIIILCFLVPWRLAFFDDEASLSWFIADSGIDCFFLVDIVLNFFTVYTNRYEDYVTDRRLIALNYLKGWFIFDIISILPIEYLIGDTRGLNDLARLARVLRMYKLVKIFRLVKQSGKIQKYAQEWLQIGMIVERSITFLFLIGITTHVFACIWYFLSKWYDFSHDTWVYRTGLADATDFNAYIYCFYFIIQVLTTVGYGDITIHSSTEKLVIMIIMLVGVVVFSFAFGSLLSALTNIDSRAAKLKEKKFELNSIKRKYNLPEGLYERIFKYFKFEIEQDSSTELFIQTLPVVLRNELILMVNNQIINTLWFFKTKNKEFCAAAASHFKSTKAFQGDCIYEENDPILEVFFLLEGEAGYTISKKGTTIVYSKIKPGELFGDVDMASLEGGLTEVRRQFTVKAREDCELIFLKKESIVELQKDYPVYTNEIFHIVNFRRDQLLKCKAVAKKRLQKEVKISMKRYKTEKKEDSMPLKRMDTIKIADLKKETFIELDERTEKTQSINLYTRRRAIRIYDNLQKVKDYTTKIIADYKKNSTKKSKMEILLDQISVLIAERRKERNKKLEEARNRLKKFREMMKAKSETKVKEEEAKRKRDQEERKMLKMEDVCGIVSGQEMRGKVQKIVLKRKIMLKYRSKVMNQSLADKWNIPIV
ncbi:unnamed protein product [Moneuplotes crassus]|uniref:Cyclic nucleotide-binding domain-containing protein n=1 Tax=Euplotes crassus TaxID=5936 RepID=A0AAD2D4U2_EUPCR|nr:unnamed protein product [Moneuplotes crassus]